MSNLTNLTNKLSELSKLLEDAIHDENEKEIERLEDEIYIISDEIEDEEDSYKW